MQDRYRTGRMGIFVFYDASGIVDGYVLELLSGITSVLDRLVIIVNGIIDIKSRQKLGKFSREIFVRENIGFDAGAYKDAFTKFLAAENWGKWDEIVLLNDTFYAPIHPWEYIFEKTEKEETDFWGLSRYLGNDYPSHIQSYFLVCRKNLICHPSFRSFWEMLEYPSGRSEATKNFEVKFTVFFEEKGFLWKAYMDVCENRIVMERGGSPYMHYAYELLRELQFPVLKRNTLAVTNFIRAKKALDYVQNETAYDVELIYRHLGRLAAEKQIKSPNPLELEDFCRSHGRVFIYGHGEFGRNVAAFMEYKGWDYEGFLVSVKSDEEEDTYAYHEVDFTEDDGIILALGYQAWKEVYFSIKDDFAEGQLFF